MGVWLAGGRQMVQVAPLAVGMVLIVRGYGLQALLSFLVALVWRHTRRRRWRWRRCGGLWRVRVRAQAGTACSTQRLRKCWGSLQGI